MRFLKESYVSYESVENEAFAKDAVDLFSSTVQGHMEKWEYASPAFENDPASGASHWANLIKHPGAYYLIEEDVKNIHYAIRQKQFREILKLVDAVVELGPGCATSLRKKTIPFIRSVPNITSYTAIDGTLDVARNAETYVSSYKDISSQAVSFDFFQSPLVKSWTGRSAVIFWGSSLGNFDGFSGDNPFSKLVQFIKNLSSSLNKGDLLVFSFDTETRKDKVIASYREPNLSRQILSILYRLRREGVASNGLNPYMWRHEAVWVKESLQCCHTIYPILDQDFMIQDRRFKVSAGQRFISNNSYKYEPRTMQAAATMAGLQDVQCYQSGSMALLVASK